MPKSKMPTVDEFLKTKRIYSKKQDLEWEYLEKEMLDNVASKPYNQIVHDWLVYLKELRHYRHAELKRKERRLHREAGPPWYMELSTTQRNVLANLRSNIHQDLLENLPRRIRKSLSDLGITLKIPKQVLMKTMAESVEDPGVFMWTLFKNVYNFSPSEIRTKYDMNAKILMSSLVFIDMDECIETLEDLTKSVREPRVPPKPEKNKYYEPKGQFGVYLQRIHIPLVSSYKTEQKSKPLPLGNKLRLRSEESYENLIRDGSFLEKRKDRNRHEKEKERVCNYKFWEPPSTLRNTDPKMVAYVMALKMLKRKPKPRHDKYKPPYENVQYLIAGVSFTKGKPSYLLASVANLPTGYILINGGIVIINGTAVTNIIGMWRYPTPERKKCDLTCECLTKWEESVMQYLKESKCKCGHLYDLFNEGKLTEKYFYPSDRHGKFWLDKAKIYQMDPMEDFIKDTVAEAVKSGETTPTTVEPSISAAGLKESELIESFMADLADTALIIPHLPQAKNLNNLQQWARKRVKGDITPKTDKKLLLQSQRRWLDLKHMDYRARAKSIPFTQQQLSQIKWSHRYMVQKLFDKLLEDFVSRNRQKLVEQTRMWWSTTKYDTYPSKAFLDIFFTYLPGRMKDTHLINPYSSFLTPKYGAKTCPLDL